MRLEHVNLTVTDVERSVDFYSKLLDLQVRWEGRDEVGAPMAHVGSEDHYLALFQASADGRAPRDYSTVGFNHVGFVVDDLSGPGNAEGLGTTPSRGRVRARAADLRDGPTASRSSWCSTDVVGQGASVQRGIHPLGGRPQRTGDQPAPSTRQTSTGRRSCAPDPGPPRRQRRRSGRREGRRRARRSRCPGSGT